MIDPEPAKGAGRRAGAAAMASANIGTIRRARFTVTQTCTAGGDPLNSVGGVSTSPAPTSVPWADLCLTFGKRLVRNGPAAARERRRAKGGHARLRGRDRPLASRGNRPHPPRCGRAQGRHTG